MSYLYEVASNSIKIRKSRELRRLVKLNWDQYKLDSREFILKDSRLDFIWNLIEVQLLREKLNELDKDINLGIIKSNLQLYEEDNFVQIEEMANRIPEYIHNYLEFPFFSNVFGLYNFFQQLFKIHYSRAREKTARYFVRSHPEIIEAYIISPENLVFVGREILPEESENLAKAPGITLESDRVLVTYPRFTNAALIKTEIKRCIRRDGIRKYTDITPELLVIESYPKILFDFKKAKQTGKSVSLTIPGKCNPNILLLLLNELCA